MRRKERYGIPAKEVEQLYGRYRKQNLAEGFGSFDSFLQFCKESGYGPGMRMCRYDPHEPHGPDNTFFREKAVKEKIQKENTIQQENTLCANCSKKCPTNGVGCREYQKAWIEHWNRNIHFKKQEEKTDPRKRQFFRYEHPDLVREAQNGKKN